MGLFGLIIPPKNIPQLEEVLKDKGLSLRDVRCPPDAPWFREIECEAGDGTVARIRFQNEPRFSNFGVVAIVEMRSPLIPPRKGPPLVSMIMDCLKECGGLALTADELKET